MIDEGTTLPSSAQIMPPAYLAYLGLNRRMKHEAFRYSRKVGRRFMEPRRPEPKSGARGSEFPNLKSEGSRGPSTHLSSMK